MENLITSYKEGYYPFPRHDISSDKKLEKWHKDFSEAIFAAWIAGNTGIPYSKIQKYKELRQFGNGTQPISKYQNIFLGQDEENSGGENKEGFYNLNWEIFSVAPKFKCVVMGIMESQDHSIVANAVDKLSRNERDSAKWNRWFESVYRKELVNIRESIGVKQSMGGYLPETIEELELFENMGGFKLRKEASIEKGLSYGFYISDWKQVKRKLIEDFIDINIAATKDFVDLYTQKVKCRYVDPAKLVIQYSRRNDFRDSEYAGEIIRMNITDLRKNTNLTEDQLRGIASKYNNVGGNPDFSVWDNLELDDGTYKYDGFWVDVMDCEFFTVNDKYYSIRKNQAGNEVIHEEKGKNYGKIYDSEKRKTKKTTTKTVHRAKWIIGTDHIFDWGLQFDIPRQGKKEVELSYHVYKLPGRSIIDRTTTNHDQIQLTWLKLQNAIAMASPAGIAVEWTSLQNMKLGGNKMDPLELLEIRRATGDLVYRATTHKGYINSPHAGKPVQETMGGIGTQLDEFIKIFQMNFEFIRGVTGINRIADASDPDPEQSVFGSKLAIAGTANALKNLYSGYIDLKEKTAKVMSLRLQIIIKHNKQAYEGYYPILGKTNLEVLSIGSEIIDADYHIKIEAKPTEALREKIRGAALEAMKPDREGFTGLEMGDYLLIENILENGDLKFAQAMISYKSMKNKERQKKLKRENMTIDSENQLKAIKAKGEENKKLEKFKTDEKIRLDNAQTENKKELNEQQHQYKMAETGKKEQVGAIRDALKGEIPQSVK